MTAWDRHLRALQLLAVDPVGLGGIVVRSRSGPVRDRFMVAAQNVLPPLTKIHPSTSLEQLDGGIDLAQTLSGGKMIRQRGIFDRQGGVLLTMAERCAPALAARLAQGLDGGEVGPLIALDEGAEEDETIRPALADRMAFLVSLDDLSIHETDLPDPDPQTAKTLLRDIQAEQGLITDLVHLCVALGIPSLRAPGLALRAAKASAALLGRDRVEQTDIEIAVALTLAPRATQMPSQEETPEQQPETEQGDAFNQTDQLAVPDEILLEAVKVALPDGVLAILAGGAQKAGQGSGSGQRKLGNRRGRPLPARNIRARRDARIDILATLRAAIPWQNMRRNAQPERLGAIIQPQDLRAKRYQDHSDRLLIFTVDASGSAALARMAEAKGAVELLLADAYARRDHVALVAFRGTDAEVLLPPTRSLVQTKRRLAELPGGGGTPVAAGLQAALDMASTATRKGLTPTVVLMTDGRSNVALDGSGNRAQADEDAQQVARMIAAAGVETLCIDTGKRPGSAVQQLSAQMAGRYLPLPRADAHSVSSAVANALDT